jgi:hypothetical protein
MYNLIVILNQDTTDRQITVTTYKDEQTAINQSLDLLSLYLSEHQYCFGPDAT